VYGHAAMVMSCDVNADLLIPENWVFSEPVPFDYFAPELEGLKKPVMTIEGTLVVSPDGELLNVMRFGMPNHILAYKVNTKDPHAPLEYKKVIPFEANLSKFTIKYDSVTKKYYSLATRIHNPETPRTRNLLSLMVSEDLNNWKVLQDVIDFRACDPQTHGFQYVDFAFDGDDIIFLCRTAMNNPHNYHDANYSTFHKIENFRNL
ncbi:MAG: hypothetical protein IKJ55_03555, partial [Clostridia bacterium]|nr:hypothetical protein [Clostridia bacterium]